MFLGAIFESSRTRVIGVDGKAGPVLLSALSKLCQQGWLSGLSCGNVALAYETTNMGQGWYRFHHHHAHISLKPASFTDAVACAAGDGGPGCDPIVKSVPRRQAGIHRLVYP